MLSNLYTEYIDMKLSYLIAGIAIILANFQLSAQSFVRIKYEETIYLNPGPEMPPQMAAQMPKSRKMKKILLAGESQSIYFVNKEDPEPDPEANSGRGRWGMRRQGVDPKVFCDYDQEQKRTYTDLFGKEFLIDETLSAPKWKLHSGEQRDILGYTCIKATTQRDSTVITAWFTPKLSLSIGPDGYYGLPGTILAISEGESKVFLATAIEDPYTGQAIIEKPVKGQSITREEFEKVRKEKIEEMRQMYGGQGQRMFIRGN